MQIDSNVQKLNKKDFLLKSDFKGLLTLGWVVIIFILGVYLSLSKVTIVWFIGQLFLALNFIQWFVLLHETGHKSLFKSSILNKVFGLAAGFFCMIPFFSWQPIHELHHQWTGWRDRDPTTKATLLGQNYLKLRKFLQTCWVFWIPIFSISYRLNNYWNLKSLSIELETDPAAKYLSKMNILMQLGLYLVCIIILGPAAFLKIFGFSFFLSLAAMDPILLSQHSQILMEKANDQIVKPVKTDDQVQYTRSIEAPRFLSMTVLFGFDRHEAHHQVPNAPWWEVMKVHDQMSQGYENNFKFFQWIKNAKKTDVFDLVFSEKARADRKI